MGVVLSNTQDDIAAVHNRGNETRAEARRLEPHVIRTCKWINMQSHAILGYIYTRVYAGTQAPPWELQEVTHDQKRQSLTTQALEQTGGR